MRIKICQNVGYKVKILVFQVKSFDFNVKIRSKWMNEINKKKTNIKQVSFDWFVVQVEIELEDVNDNDPELLVNTYRATVAETVPLLPPPPIVQVTAVDLDAGINSALRYNIIEGNDEGLFRLDPETGILYPVVSLAGKPREYSLSVEVSKIILLFLLSITSPNLA